MFKLIADKKAGKYFYIGAVIPVALGFYLINLYNHLLFHSLIEITTIAIGLAIFILTWNSRQFLTNSCVSFLGIGYVFIALIDLIHTLAFKGINVFSSNGPSNLSAQLWIAARYLQAVTLISASFFVERRLNYVAVLGGYAVAVSTLMVMVFSGNFPECFIVGKGLTAFKVNSEYVISAFLVASLYLFFRKREYFNNRVFIFIATSISCTVLSELFFTTYLNMYSFANFAGHFTKLVAFYLIYQAILVTGIREPFDLIFRTLKQKEEMLQKSLDTLDAKVIERTAELNVSEEKYRVLIENANDAIFINEVMEDGMLCPFMEVNELACRQLGYSREELLKLNLIELNDPCYRNSLEETMKLIFKDSQAVFETAQMTKDGRSIPIEVSCRVIVIRGKRLLFSLVRDITERKQAEAEIQKKSEELSAANEELSETNEELSATNEELAATNEEFEAINEELIASNMDLQETKETLKVSESILKKAQQMAKIGNWEFDVSTGKVFASDEFYRIYGLTPSEGNEIDIDKVAACIPDRTKIRQALTDLINYGTPYDFEIIINPANGEESRFIHSIASRIQDGKDAPKRAVGVIQDITERKLAESALRKSEALLSTVQQISKVGGWEYNVVTGQSFWTEELYRIHEISNDQDIDHISESLKCYRPEDSQIIHEAFRKACEEGKAYDLEFPFTTMKGKHLWIRTTAEPVYEENKVICLIGNVMDITDRKQAEEKIHKLNQELEQRVMERTKELEKKNMELEKMNKMFVGRELSMIELKKKIAKLEKTLNDNSIK